MKRSLFLLALLAVMMFPPIGGYYSVKADDRLGVDTKLEGIQDPAILPLLKNMGADWIRDGVSVAEIVGANASNNYTPQPQSTWVFPRQDIDWIRLAGQNGFKVVLLVDYWSDPAIFSQAAAFVAKILANDPTLSAVKAIEVESEYDSQIIAGQTVQQYYGGSEGYAVPEPGWEANYNKIFAATLSAVRAVNPNLQIIGGGCSTASTYCEIANGMTPDGITDHPYWVNREPEYMPNNTAGDGIATTSPDGYFNSYAAMWHNFMTQKLGKTVGIWLTEGGKESYNWGELYQGVSVLRRVIECFATGVDHTFIYTAQDEADGTYSAYNTYGLLTGKTYGQHVYHKKQVYYLLQRFTHLIGGAPASNNVTASFPTGTIGRAYSFDDPHGTPRTIVPFWIMDPGTPADNTGANMHTDPGPTVNISLSIIHPTVSKVWVYDPVQNNSHYLGGYQYTGSGVTVSVPATTFPQFVVAQ